MTDTLTEIRSTPKEWTIWIALFILPLLFYPVALRSTWVSNSDVHASLEFWASLIALAAAGIVLIHFFAIGNKFFLMICLGFTLQGAIDLIHAIYSFERIWTAEQAGIVNFVPGTYVSGRLILVACILISLYLARSGTVVEEKDRSRMAIVYTSIGFLLAIIATTIVINSPLPQFILPGQVISRPVDFVAAIIYLVAFFLFVKLYHREGYHTPFIWSMIASIIFGFATQVYMVHSQQLYDAQFDISHVLKIFSYMFPVFGISLGTFTMYKQEGTLSRNLAISMEKEKRSTVELQRLKEGLEAKVSERTKELEAIKNNLEKAVEERTKELTESQTAMLYMIEDLNRQTKEIKDAQDRIVRSEKLAAIGQLASSVAHELRNPLGVMKNAIYYFNMLGLGKDNAEVKENLDILSKEIENSDKIISDLLEFARIKKPTLRPEKINLIVKETLDRLRIGPDIKVATELKDPLPDIEVDALQIQQVFYNMTSNAIQAMDKGGRLKIKTGLKGDFLETSFSDTGSGISKEKLAKIFDPLFSTKAKGTGLGLSVCASIVEGHQGKIEVESEVGKGTTFTVRLPIKRG